jgi:hypothetical protein
MPQLPNEGVASDPVVPMLKGILISDSGDGKFTVVELDDGKPVGDPVPAESLDEVLANVTSKIGGGETGDVSEAKPTETEIEESEPMEAMDEEKAKYAQKRGTRPKEAPNWQDYVNTKNPMAK